MSSQIIFLWRGIFQPVLQAQRMACGTSGICGYIPVKFNMKHGKDLLYWRAKKEGKTMDGAIPIKLKFFPIICNPLIEKTI